MSRTEIAEVHLLRAITECGMTAQPTGEELEIKNMDSVLNN
jgi:hypothetical protein